MHLATTTGEVLADDVLWARSSTERARGLIGKPPLRNRQALILEGRRQVHTFGVRYPLDVVFCDGDWRVCRIVRSLRPMRVSRWVRGARFVIELPAGAAASLQVGDHVELKDS